MPEFIPKRFGILLAADGVAYIIDSIFFIMFPGSGIFLRSVILMAVFSVAEISFILWFVIKGVSSNTEVRAEIEY